ncbi:ABC-F family ATP-binding cassette domain-containing protein [Fusibacter tunisiensis]|uniref:ATP-binding cassette subfamily F protein 3 n=1 Tax=Fusibacter tunisiensis TaxID=1008308 RepID=A0ABS2MPN1_9FIRM|nr:ABC-F type ribosomal protection protein [Fusibacter tunisiensis]MBM7561353.1 ATP-binding cassette subfamily F protein 3 [Fusibacter tunisiensis]
MIAISCKDIQKIYGIDEILAGINFTINTGDKIGLIGVNGAGKTTLIKILTGIESKDAGDIFIGKDLTIGYLEQNTRIDSEISAFDYCASVFESVFELEHKMRALEQDMQHMPPNQQHPILDTYAALQTKFEQLDGYTVSSKIRGVLNGLGFTEKEHQKPINQLSGGQKSRVGIARLLLTKPDILFLDEPTNHLDIEAIKWLETYLKEYEGTIVMISHDRYFLDQIVTRILEVENKSIQEYTGNYSAYLTQKKARIESELKQYEQQQKEIQKQEEIIRRFKGHGTEKLTKRAKSREKRLAQMSLVERPTFFKNHFKLHLKSFAKSGKDVLQVENLYKSYGSHTVLKDLSFEIYNGERIGLVGPNGVGKTTLFKILIQEIDANSGKIHWGHHVHPGYYDQELGNLQLNKTVIEEIHDENPTLTLTEVRSLLGAFLFEGDDIEKQIRQLSGGERSRVSLLKLMLSDFNTLFLDEPTNHLDIYAKESLEDALLSYDGTLVAISHDRFFLNKICTKIFELTENGLAVYWGNYDYFQLKKEEATAFETAPISDSNTNKTRLKEKQRKEKEAQQALKKQKQTLKALETSIETHEEKVHQLELDLCDESIYSDPDKSAEVQRDIKRLKDELVELYSQLDEYLEIL